ncbi:MAG: MobF family relaxase [Actinomycetota bacterium]
MFNIGRLGAGAADYYTGKVARTADQYYLGHGEAPGRWVGSLAEQIGLTGHVDPLHFRRVLEGQDPFTGAYLTTAQGSAARAAARRAESPGAAPARGAALDTLQVACRLGVSEQRVRQLLAAGERMTEQLAVEAADCGRPSPWPKLYLLGDKVTAGRGGREKWKVAPGEVARFLNERKPAAKARPGYDVVLRPPKSVSLLWALGADDVRETVRRAHHDAVDQTVRFLESQAVSARSRRRRTATDGVVAAAFDHRTSRAGDPLLHSHVVIANMTRTVRGDWRTLDGRGLFDHGRAAGALYQAHLRHVLTRDLGVAWEPVVNGHADVAGVPRPVIEMFSKRREEIEETVAEAGLSSARAHQAATLATRQAKDHSVDPGTLRRQWQAEAAAAGFDPAAIGSCLRRSAPEPVSADRLDVVFTHLAGPHGLTERAASFDRGDVIEALAGSLVADVDADTLGRLADRFLSSPLAVPLVDATTGRSRFIVTDADGTTAPVVGEVRWTTPELIEQEAKVLTWARDGFGASVPTATDGAVEAALAARPGLSGEQVEMVRAVCGGDEAVQTVVGRAGSGKTTAVGACAEAFTASGLPVVGCSVSATAAARLEEATGLELLTGRPCDTIARLLVELDDPTAGGFAPGTVCIVDEASTVGTRDLAHLGAHLARAGGRLVLVGDPDQLPSVDVGGTFAAIVAERGDAVPTLTANRRQQDEEERAAVADYRQGRIAEALARYDAAGKIVRSPTLSASLDAMVADWYTDRLAGIDAPMIAGPNSMRRRLNARARALLKADGTLTGPALRIGGAEFCTGDDVVARENNRRLHAPGRRAFVKNGSRGIVTEVNPDAHTVTVAFAKEGTIRLPTEYLQRGKLEHAYAQTNFLAQGLDQRRTKYHPTDASRFEEGYVGLTRAVEETRVYLVEGTQEHADRDLVHAPDELVETGLEAITTALGRRGAQVLAHDLDPGLRSRNTDLEQMDPAARWQERRRLDAILARTPAAVDHALAEAIRERDQLVTRHKALAMSPTGPSKASENTDNRLTVIERSLARIETRIENLRHRQAERRAFLAAHEKHIARRAALLRAESTQELRTQSAAARGTILPRPTTDPPSVRPGI